MYQEWLVEFAFPFWALIFGCDMYKNARRHYKRAIGLVSCALGGWGLFLLTTGRASDIPLLSQASLAFVGRYGDIGAFLIAGLIVANLLARIGNFPPFRSHSSRILFCLILVNAFAVINNFYSNVVFSLIAAVLVSAFAAKFVGNFDIGDLVDFY
jgi:hypothetical protein